MAEDKGAQRVYVVLRAAQDDVTFTAVGVVEAHSAASACRTAVEATPELADDGLDFIAIPQRTWQTNRTTLKVDRPLRVRTS